MAQKRSSGVMKTFEGKVPLSFQLYCTLSKLALFVNEVRSSFAGFVHLFMILCWNLFARSNNVEELRTEHLSWDNDSLVVNITKHKADQSGEKSTPKHVFANPFNPEICPILALGLHVFTITFRQTGENKTKLFSKVNIQYF